MSAPGAGELEYPRNAMEADDMSLRFRWVEEMDERWGERETVEAYLREHDMGHLKVTRREKFGWGFWG